MEDRVERIVYTENKSPGYLIGGFILGIGFTCSVLSLYGVIFV